MIILSGHSLRNVKMFGKMDPYVVVESKNIKYKTVPDQEGNTAPTWNHSLHIPIHSLQDDMKISVYDSGAFIDECVGSASISVQSLQLNNNGEIKVPLFHKQTTKAGELKISCLV